MKQLELYHVGLIDEAKQIYRALNRLWDKHKQNKPLEKLKSPEAKATRLIVDGKLSRGEAIDYLTREHGWSEDKAMDWAMRGFTGTNEPGDAPSGGLRSVDIPNGRSARRKAA